MAVTADKYQPSSDDDLQSLSDLLSEVLAYSGDRADEAFTDIKAKAEQALKEIQGRITGEPESYYDRAKQAVQRTKEVAHRTDNYVHDKPWQSVGIGVTVGVVLGVLLTR